MPSLAGCSSPAAAGHTVQAQPASPARGPAASQPLTPARRLPWGPRCRGAGLSHVAAAAGAWRGAAARQVMLELSA